MPPSLRIRSYECKRNKNVCLLSTMYSYSAIGDDQKEAAYRGILQPTQSWCRCGDQMAKLYTCTTTCASWCWLMAMWSNIFEEELSKLGLFSNECLGKTCHGVSSSWTWFLSSTLKSIPMANLLPRRKSLIFLLFLNDENMPAVQLSQFLCITLPNVLKVTCSNSSSDENVTLVKCKTCGSEWRHESYTHTTCIPDLAFTERWMLLI